MDTTIERVSEDVQLCIGGTTPEMLAQVLPEQIEPDPSLDELLEIRCSSY